MLRNKAEILECIASDSDMMAILTIICDLELKDSWLAAGAVRNFIWNTLSGKPGFDRETDVDVVFYDPEVSYEETLALEEKLRETHPQYRWELKNQVYMHVHSPHTKPYLNSCDAISKYPERCTAIGARLSNHNQVDLFTPFGIEDIVNFHIRATPHFEENPERMQVYKQRLAKKNWQSKWPQLQIVEER